MVGRRSRAAQRGFVVEQVHSGEGIPETAHGAPGQLLADYVRGYRGYRNERGGSAQLRLVPSTQINLDISLGVLPRLNDSNAVPAGAVYGMRTGPAALARFDGPGILVELSPHGAYALLSVSPWEVTDTVIDVVDVLGRRAEQMVDRLAETSGWQARLALLDDALAAQAEAGPRPAPQVVWAWRQLCRSHGRIPIAQLAAEVGWTRRHLLNRFREQIGLPPKTAARVIRFQHALQLLQQPGRRLPLASLAQATGYSDQAHLTREFRTLAGATPVELTTAGPRHEGDAASI
jgi:AraC-like DNA-binding protein